MKGVGPYRGIDNKILNKTRIVKEFIWFKTIKKKWKFLQNIYILQKCKLKEGKLYWSDIKFTKKHTTFLKCSCGNELTTSGSFISDNKEGVLYKCTDCGITSLWDFDHYLIPVKIKMTIPVGN